MLKMNGNTWGIKYVIFRLTLFGMVLGAVFVRGGMMVSATMEEKEEAETSVPFQVSAHSAILIEQSTGEILYEKNTDEILAPASVTKIMTILLVMEALERGDVTREDIVSVSAQAAGMGGSQVYLKAGETMTLWELLKCVVVVSGNDASVALAEYISGSEEAFVEKMNEKATLLSMEQTQFLNCTGLPEEGHGTTAYDIALMSRELLVNHPEIQELTSIWMDTIREGEFGLSNTNRLIHDYSGATGLKTGSTDSALYCMAASAQRNDMDLIAVVLKSPTSSQRFEDAKTLLDYGFSTYSLEEIFLSTPLPPVSVLLGEKDSFQPTCQQPVTLLLEKSEIQSLTTQVQIPETLEAPIAQGEQIGTFDIFVSGTLKESVPIVAMEEVGKLSLWGIYWELIGKAFMTS